MHSNDTLTSTEPASDESPDSAARVQDFLSRHGGPSTASTRKVSTDSDARGWSEVYAADGYTLRCEWSKFGSKQELKFSEVPPGGPPSDRLNHRM